MEVVKNWFKINNSTELNEKIMSNIGKNIEKNGLNYDNIEMILKNKLRDIEENFIKEMEDYKVENKDDWNRIFSGY